MPYLSQDGGDGEHASIVVANAVRDAVSGVVPSLGDISSWGLTGFGELDASDENQTVFGFTAGDTDFHLVLTKVTE